VRSRALAFLLCLVLAVAGCASPRGSGAEPSAPPAQPAAGGDEWEQVVAEAKREGKVSVIGPAAVQTRDALTTAFQRAYPEIEVQYDSSPGAQLPPRLLAERAADRYSVDMVIVGTTTLLASLKPAGVLDPVLPYLGGPSTRDLSKWQGGALNFADNDRQYALVFSEYVKGAFFYNPTLVNPEDVHSYRDLLDPRWKGKMAMYDPRLAGAGQGVVLYWYTLPELGPEFVRQMMGQGIAFSRDERQVLDWVARGQYPIVLGVGDAQAAELIHRGLPIKVFESDRLAEQPYVTAGTGSLGVLNHPPHPNAARVYLDFLLSAEGQTEWSRAVGFASDRLDVPRDHVEPFFILRDGVDYQRQQNEPYIAMREEVDQFIKSVAP
jgi:iron(III) transport system substrate-binding protein